MNKIQQMIEELCPEGVEYKTLAELGSFYGGLTGKTKDDFKEGNAKFITYMNVYSNPSTDLNINDCVAISPSEKQNTVCFGDILFTGSSETPNECGMSSVVTQEPKEDYYLNSFSFGFRLNEPSLFDCDFLKHIFRSYDLRRQISKTANGVTRYNVSKKLLAQISIPLPPLSIQSEIVKILDKFSALQAELEAKLEAELVYRKRQYEYYRDRLIAGDAPPSAEGASLPHKDCKTPIADDIDKHDSSAPCSNIKWMKMGEVGTFTRGSGLQKKDFTQSGVGCIHYGQIYTYYGLATTTTKSFVDAELAKKLKTVHKNDIVFAVTSENVEDLCKCVAWLGEEDIVTGGHAVIFSHHQNAKYLAYYFQTEHFAKQKRKYAKGVKVMDIKAADMEKLLIPVPPLSEQARIADILDRFEALTTSISEGLPAEIAARRQQYEYYRDKLLTFKRRAS